MKRILLLWILWTDIDMTVQLKLPDFSDPNFGRRPPRRHSSSRSDSFGVFSGFDQSRSFPSIKSLGNTKKVLQCNGNAIWIDPKILGIDSECLGTQETPVEKGTSSEAKFVSDPVPFNCRIACRWEKQGWLRNGTFRIAKVNKFIDSFFPLLVRRDLKRGFKRCFDDQPTYDKSQDDESCQKLSSLISCLRRAHFETCNEHTEDLFTNYYPDSFNKWISYGYCRDTQVKWSAEMKFIDEGCKVSELSFTCHQRCSWETSDVLTRNGNINATVLADFVEKTFPVGAARDIKDGIQRCYENHPPGKLDNVNKCLNSKPFFNCIHSNFFKVCRPDDYLIEFPERYF